jgi:hypothetical protein
MTGFEAASDVFRAGQINWRYTSMRSARCCGSGVLGIKFTYLLLLVSLLLMTAQNEIESTGFDPFFDYD